MADFGGADLDAFRGEVREWLKANFPESLSGRGDLAQRAPGKPQTGDIVLWTQRVGQKGWGTPTWPTAYGGAGLSQDEANVLRQEMGRIGAFNPIVDIGARMLGPTLLEFGTEAQKLRHLPPIARGERRWCQGYSEPGAGSDLASLQLKCVDAGDHWLLNGQKIWTSGAHYADWCFCLVRTDTSKKHEGISFVLLDMRQPGIEPRPIKMISGDSHFCETFFTDARAEKDDMVGPPNQGWTVAKRLTQHERATHDGGDHLASAPLHLLAKSYLGLDDQGRLSDLDLRARIIQHQMDVQAHALTIQRIKAETKGRVSAVTSILKNSAGQNLRDRNELTIELLGGHGLGWEGAEFGSEELGAVRAWLGGKAMTIAGGSFEIQYNIISKRILGLPDPLQGQ